ncbi:MAG TPA: LuxR C-terminal-related transcriptional regulator [Bacillota bacterium]|nr:LuxR C-terminal-related transcriptional regulator [Bacillota bacterium]HOR86527.1 LuxR C-terminal-related transcriptional regulator [Bacillota bacterium]HPL52518.1 LuxR C-terminal-related transcriptional regulator [Bacillota bacterium]
MEGNMRSLSIIVFSLFFSWLLAFPFQGQILLALAAKHGIDSYSLAFGSTAAHFAGLFISGFLVKTIGAAKRLMLFSIVFCIGGSLLFFLPPSMLWYVSLVLMSFLSGACVAAWGFYFKKFTPSNERIKTAADALIYSNILMIVINASAILLSPYLGLTLSMLMLATAFFLQLRLPGNSKKDMENRIQETKKDINPAKPLGFLCLFIAVITINSGLMYQVVNPAFAHHKWLVSWYWAVPYIIALFIVRNLPPKTNRNYMLYIGIAMIGLSFIGFMMFDRSAPSYLFIDTLMLGACGVYDLFWWSILGEMLDFHDNPAKILGIGLSANVLGVLTGGMLGSIITASGIKNLSPSVLALVIVFIILVLLPLLHRHLSNLLKNHAFLTALNEMTPIRQEETIDCFTTTGILTERESEIAALLLKGRTYKMIAVELYLSENTIKTHIKNIYSKFNVQSKSELIGLLMQKKPYINK